MQSWCNICINSNFKNNNNPGWSHLAFKFILLKLEKAITQKYGPVMFSSAPAMSVSPPDWCVRSWCPCDGVRGWPRGDTSSWESRPQEWGQCYYRGPRSPSPFLPVRSTWPWPWPWPQPLLASSLQNGLLFTSLHGCGLLLQQPKGTKALHSHCFREKGSVCVCVCVCSVHRLCVCCVCLWVLCRIRPLTLTFYRDEP